MTALEPNVRSVSEGVITASNANIMLWRKYISISFYCD